MRRAAKVDSNQEEIVKAARALGCTVQSLAAVGKGCPDLLIGVYMGRRVNLLVEVKDPSKPPSARKLTPDQVEFHATWRGQVAVVETVQDLIDLIKGIK